MSHRMSIAFEVPGPPQSWKRTNDHGGKRLTSAKMRQYKSHIATAASAALARKRIAHQWPLDAAYNLVVYVYRRFEARTYPGDRDNYGKVVQDALEGILWDDDRRVIDGRDVKLCAGEQRMEVLVEVAGEHDDVCELCGGTGRKAE